MKKVKTKQKKTKGKKKKFDLLNFIIYACVLIGWYSLTFGASADLVNKIYNQSAILAYNNTMVSYSDEDITEMTNKMVAYNESIYEEQKTQTFKYRGPNATDDTYKSLPTASETIGTIDIPRIDEHLSFNHGTSEATLQSYAGHVYGTSLPIEGENVHAVIAAHSALSTAKLFTDLNKLSKGDAFYITVLNTKYEYKVDEINIMLPEEDYKYEQIEEGKNYVTLYTCTPYGINTHRLLVRGELVGSEKVEGTDDAWNVSQYLGIIKYSCMLAGIILAPGIALWAYQFWLKHKNKDGNSKKDKKSKKKSKKLKDKSEKKAGILDNDETIPIEDDFIPIEEADFSDFSDETALNRG